MRYCEQCGRENKDIAKFCGSCGAPLNEVIRVEAPMTEPDGPKKSKKKYIILACVILILAAVAVATIFLLKVKKEKEYETYISQAERYVENLDYEKAETSYLEAIAIDPKQREPYVELAKIYLEQNRTDEAEEILARADKEEAVGSEELEEEELELEERIDQIRNMIDYTWVVEPTIEADDIYYVSEYNVYGLYGGGSLNESYRQMMSPYAVIKKDDALGLIDMNGELKGGMDYKEIYSMDGRYHMVSTVSKYESEFDTQWDLYGLSGDEIVPMLGLGDWGASAFYYSDGLHEVNEASEYYSSVDEPIVPIPVRESENVFEYKEYDDAGYVDPYDWWGNLESNYAVYYNGSLKTDFVYEECGSSVDELLAVCQNGKWGYVNSEGEIVIPIEYDVSWNQFELYWDDFQNEQGIQEYCYAFSGGYVPLVKDGQWELRDADGKVAIPFGIFEKICPVYENKCWVKVDGKWGVIELQTEATQENDESQVSTEENETKYAAVFEQYIDALENDLYKDNLDLCGDMINIELLMAGQYYRNFGDSYSEEDFYIYYAFEDMNDDGQDELFISAGTASGHIYDMFYFDGEKPVALLGTGFGYRMNMYMLEDHTFYITGSSGYNSNSITHYYLSPDTYEFIQIEEWLMDEGICSYTGENGNKESITEQEFSEVSSAVYDMENALSWELLGDSAYYE